MFATSFLFIDCGYIIPQDKVFFCNEVTLIKKSGAQKSTGFLKDELRFPQTVEVAVGVDRFDLIALAESEADLRLFAGMQFLTLIALLGLERYPFQLEAIQQIRQIFRWRSHQSLKEHRVKTDRVQRPGFKAVTQA